MERGTLRDGLRRTTSVNLCAEHYCPFDKGGRAKRGGGFFGTVPRLCGASEETQRPRRVRQAKRGKADSPPYLLAAL
jgi:hypothetical protein